MMPFHRPSLVIVLLIVSVVLRLDDAVAESTDGAAPDLYNYVTDPHQIEVARMLVSFFEDQSRPPAFQVHTGSEFISRRNDVRQQILKSIALAPLPERVPLDIHQSEALRHPWCTVQKIHYQIWPGIYTEAFLYLPNDMGDEPRPAILSLTGHWPNGKAYADEQKRCLNFARLGYVVLAPDANHYEDLPIGISHQTHMVWSNIRALDVIQSLPEVDRERIAACGGSGGGYQAQMLLAVDDRLKAAAIMGFTCDWRETVFPHVGAHGCLHYPGALTIANQPEVSALAMPVPVQYLTMNDYTRNFADNAFPAIQMLYEQNGYPDNVECKYWPTEHVYDKPKREATYRWIQKWLNGDTAIVEEPDTPTFPIPRLVALETGLPRSVKSLEDLTDLYAAAYKYAVTELNTRDQWIAYRDQKIAELRRLLGMDRSIPVVPSQTSEARVAEELGVTTEDFQLPVEGTFQVPVTVLKPAAGGPFKPVILCSADGREKMLAEIGPASAVELARSGRMVVVPDLRFFGEIDLDNLIGVGPTSLMTFVPAYSQDEWLRNQDYSFQYHIERAWKRNSIIWDRPLVGMMVSDIKSIVDHLQRRNDVDLSELEIVGRPSADDPDHSVPLAVLFAAVIDARLKQVDVDLGGRSFEERTLPAIPFILWHGDVLQWAACLGDRKLTLRNYSDKAGDPSWLKHVFACAGSAEDLQLVTQP